MYFNYIDNLSDITSQYNYHYSGRRTNILKDRVNMQQKLKTDCCIPDFRMAFHD